MPTIGVVRALCTEVKLPTGVSAINEAIEVAAAGWKHGSLERVTFRASANSDKVPFHEALPDIIKNARNAAELRFVLELLNRCYVPDDAFAYERIADAWEEVVRDMQISSPGDVRQLLASRKVAVAA